MDNSVYKSLSETTKTSNNASRRCGYFIERRIWSGKRDSNSRPRPWQGRALPTELFPLGWSVPYSTFKFWSGKRDSNSRPRPWQGRALPTELFPLRLSWSVLSPALFFKFVLPPWSWERRLFKFSGNETRTRDPDLGKVVLYQLSYSRVLLNFAFVIFAFLRRYGRRIIREIFPSATPKKFFAFLSQVLKLSARRSI